MATGTARLKSELMELLKDNLTRQIAAARIRDFLETVYGRKTAKVVTNAMSPYTLAASSDYEVLLTDVSAGDVELRLPAGDVNRQVFIGQLPDSVGSYKTTLTPNGAETVEGATTMVLHAQRPFVQLQKATGDWRALALDSHGLRRIGHYLSSPILNTAPENAVWNVDLMLLSPLVVPHDMTLDRLSVNVKATGTANNARVGIYKSNQTTLVPTDRLLDAGALDVSGTGLVEATVSQRLYRAHGLYWLCVLLDGTCDLYSAVELGVNVLGIDAATAQGWSRYEAAQAYGALPATVPAGAFQTGGFPLVMARRSA